MTGGLCFALVFLFLSGCMGMFGLNKDKFDIDNYDYHGDPVGISCVFDESMTGFHQEKINGSSKTSTELIERMKPLSLYVDGIGSHVKPNSSTFKFAKEWFRASNSNICYFTYALEYIPKGVVNTLIAARGMVKTYRLQYAAKVARDFILSLRGECLQSEVSGCLKNMSQVTVLGFSFGAHIACQTSLHVYKSTGEKVGKLIGIDPAGIYLTLKRFGQPFINRGDAEYVQIIHTDPYLFGTVFQSGDVDIYVEDIPVGMLYKHAFAAYIHMATSMKKLLMIAETNGKGKVIQIDEHSTQANRVPMENEVFVGVYDEVEESKRGRKFHLSIKDHVEMMRESIAHVVRMRLE